jgi:hypothetical protein
VDTVVTRCRGREIDKKNVSRHRYTTPETHGSATVTQNGHSSLSLLYIYIGAACVHVPCVVFFLSFFANSNLGLKLFGPIWRPTPDVLRGVARGAGRGERSTMRRTPDGLRAQAPWARRADFFFDFRIRSIGARACSSQRGIRSGNALWFFLLKGCWQVTKTGRTPLEIRST